MNKDETIIIASLRSFSDPVGLETLSLAIQPSIHKRTLQRQIRELVQAEKILKTGKGRSTRYILNLSSVKEGSAASQAPGGHYQDYIPLCEGSKEILAYIKQPLFARKPVAYDRTLIDIYEPNNTYYLEKPLRSHLKSIGSTEDVSHPAGTYGRHILDRLLIDISWSSSRLEGNTYSRLDTERLLVDGVGAKGKNAKETQMILNHKRAVELLVEDAEDIGFNKYTILNLHGLLSENLMHDPFASGCLRKRAVQIGSSVYQPTEIPQTIEETFDLILRKAQTINDPFEQGFFLLVHIPYLQPFEDVNKRVARISANIPLIKHNLCPLTFLDVPSDAYIDATLGIYEMGRIELLKDVFSWAYERSTQQYVRVKKSVATPDPVKLRYRIELHEIIGKIVKNILIPYTPVVEEFALKKIPDKDRNVFIAIALEEIKRLHEGIIARYRVRPSEYKIWKKAQKV